jgi:hypothetical protein
MREFTYRHNRRSAEDPFAELVLSRLPVPVPSVEWQRGKVRFTGALGEDKELRKELAKTPIYQSITDDAALGDACRKRKLTHKKTANRRPGAKVIFYRELFTK